MRKIITDRIKAVETFKSSKNIHPSCAFKSELQKAVFKSFNKEFEKMVNEGIIEVTGRTVNGDKHIKLR